ncbi:unnamed protein product [Phytomonas sp. EM1]|nr:unnamed protein product [Phytomonas sp. EM1]|eukprot:CCW62923.1 unnamed protein product [Phytomonas sp. isolate EM1]
MSSEPTVLHRYPGALALPTADPQALAIETALRFLQLRYVVKDAAMRELRMVIPADPMTDSTSPAVCRGFPACFRHLAALTDTDVVQSDHKHVVACVEWIATKCLFPAFTFLIHFEPNLFHYGVRKAVVPRVAGIWERLCGAFQRNVLRSNVYSYACGTATTPHGPPLSAAGIRQVKEVLEEVEKAFRALELLHLSYAQTDETFFFGTLSPCSTDAYVYAGVSCFLHADFGGPHGSPHLVAFQTTVKEECSHLVRYVEWMRQMYYEGYSAKYGLKQPDGFGIAEMEAAAAEDLYSRGRSKVLLMTGMFAFVYFIFANSNLIALFLEGILSGDSDDMTATESRDEKLKEEDIS